MQLEPDAFLSDIDFQLMTAEQRGVYWTMILYLYRNDGKVKLDLNRLTKLCNVNPDFDYQTVLPKFQVRRGFISHKRVTHELEKAQVLINRGVKAAEARWSGNAQAMHKHPPSNAKVREGKVREVKGSKEFVPPVLQEVTDYAKSRNSVIEPKKFFEFFDAADWVDSRGNKVKNWKQKFLTWEAHQPAKKTEIQSGPAIPDYEETKRINETRRA